MNQDKIKITEASSPSHNESLARKSDVIAYSEADSESEAPFITPERNKASRL